MSKTRVFIVAMICMLAALPYSGRPANPLFGEEGKLFPTNTAQAQEVKAEPEPAAQNVSQDNAGAQGDSSEEPGSSLFSTVKRGGPVMVPILLLGLIALTIIIERIVFFTKNRIWSSSQVPGLMTELSNKSATRYREDREDELKGAFQIYVNGLERGMAFLSGIGNLAPILGFLGTVTGMITAFAAIAAATTVNARVVAVGIQQALITTAGGLMVAAPTLFFYYLFSHVIQNRFAQADEAIDSICSGLPRLTEELPGETQEGVFNG